MKFSLISLVIFAMLAPSAFAQDSSKGEGQDEILAIVGARKIYLNDFNKKFKLIGSQATNPPTKQQFLEDLVRFEIGVQEAEKINLQNDSIVKDRMQQELYKALLEKELAARIDAIKVTEADMQSWYKENPEIRTSHILFEHRPGASSQQREETRQRALKIYKEVKESKRSFEDLVKIYSDDPLSKLSGGDIGWQSRITVLPAYYDAVVGAKMGTVTGLIEAPFGFHIVKLTGRRGYSAANKRQIRAAVFDERRRKIFNDYFEKTKKKYTIKLNTSLLK